MEEYIITDKQKQNWLIAICATAIFMFTLDYNMLNISLPTIASYFKVNVATVSLLPLAYIVIVTSTLLGFGKLGDLKGYKKIFIGGLIVFLAGSFLCGISRFIGHTINTLLAFRLFQCVGEAMFSPIAIALVTVFLPREMKGLALGVLAMAQGLGLALGPGIGGFINARVGWHGIFFINIPVGVATVLLAMKMLPSKQKTATDARFDIIGSALIFLSLSTLIFALNSASKIGWENPIIIIAFIVSAISFVLFILQERRITYPILDLALFKNRDFSFGGASAFFALSIYIGINFIFPFYLELVRRVDVVMSGILLMIPASVMMIVSPFAGRLSDIKGARWLCSAGLGIAAVSFVMFSFLSTTSAIWFIISSFTLTGIAMGLFMAPNNKLIMSHAPADKHGMVSGAYKIIINTGSIFGIVVMPMLLMDVIRGKAEAQNIAMTQIREHPDLMMFAFRYAFIFGIFLCLIAMVFALFANDKKD